MIRMDWIGVLVDHYNVIFCERFTDLYLFWAQCQLDSQLKDMGDWISYSSTKEIL